MGHSLKFVFCAFITLFFLFLTNKSSAQGQCCNVLTNGNFEQGSVGFSSGMAQSCDADSCNVNAYCVGHSFSEKCIAWPPFPDHTTGSGSYMLIDGNPSGPVNVWTNSVSVTAGITYCYCFWVASVYPEPFELGMMVNGVNESTVTVSQSDPTWTQYCLDWTADVSGTVQISIRQLSGGDFRDFGLDDIVFGAAITPDFSFSPGIDCGMMVSFFNQSTGPAPLTYSWHFGDPNSGNANISSLQNPNHNFSSCGEYVVCLAVKRGVCLDSICQVITVTDDEKPVITCPQNVLLAATPPNCSEPIAGIKWLSATDNCGMPSISYTVTGASGGTGQDNASGHTFSPGVSTVTYLATDKCGNTGSCSFTVTVTTVEICNGQDDDCDGEIDNNLSVCPPPSNLMITEVGASSITFSWENSPCSSAVWWFVDDSLWTQVYSNATSIVLEGITPGMNHQVYAVSGCGALMSAPSDTVVFIVPCVYGCAGNLVSNGSFDGSGAIPFPNAADQINLCPGWQQANNGNVTSIGDWYSVGSIFWIPVQFPGLYNNVAANQYNFMLPYCSFWYAGFDLNTCEGISTQLTATIPQGAGYGAGFWWAIKEPVTTNFSFLAILSNNACTVNTANGGTACTHQCLGDYHLVVPVNTTHVPGVWYYKSFNGNAPISFNRITLVANSTTMVNNYIFVDDVCVRPGGFPCHVAPDIIYDLQQPNAFLGKVQLGAGSSVVSAVWDFGDGARDSSCCVGSVIHHFMPGTYNVCLTVTAVDSEGVLCANTRCLEVVITQSSDKCDDLSVFLQPAVTGDCCYELKTNNIAPNCFTQIDVTLSTGSFINTVFGPGWNIALNGSTASLTPTAGGFIPVGQDIPITICDPGGTDPYTVDVDFLYSGGVCHQTRTFTCMPLSDPCCTDYQDFELAAMGLASNAQYVDCSIIIESVNLTDCRRVTWDWGDGMVEGPYFGNTPVSHTYTTPGPHTPCYEVEEVDANGNICWQWGGCMDYNVHCNDTCTCLGFSNMAFSYGPGPVYIWELPVDCENDPALPLPCIPSDALYNFTGNFGCSNDCTSSIQYQFFENTTLVSYGLATYGSGFNYLSLPSFKLPPGTYKLVLTGLCGTSDTCFCEVNFIVPSCPCCSQSNDAFCQTIDNAINISTDPTNCKATLNIGTLPCQRVQWIDWGDGGFSNGPFLSGAMPMHFYAHSGPYTITYPVAEINPQTGEICYYKTVSETISMDCNCSCGTYDLEIRFGGALNQPVVCGETLTLGLNQGFVLYTKFQCQGSYCPSTAQVDWVLTGPGGFVQVGSETATPDFIISAVSPGQLGVPGQYTLTMTGHCDQNLCPCVIHFNVVDPCCTDQAAFLIAAANVQILQVSGDCSLGLKADGLNDCMKITYDWGDGSGPDGPYADNALVVHAYQTSGTYTVCSKIEEIDFFGNACWNFQTCKNISVHCSGCCGDPSNLSTAVQAEVMVTVDSGLCSAAVNISDLPTCITLDSIQWGDGSQSFGPFGANESPAHTYLDGGDYVVSFSAALKDADTGLTCFQKSFSYPITPVCLTNCFCGTYNSMTFGPNGAGSPFNCGTDLPLSCQPGVTYAVSGSFACQGTGCSSSTPISWALYGPQGLVAAATVNAIPNFSILLPSGLFYVAGTYTMTLTANCGGADCVCFIYFVVSQPCPALCPCDLQDFMADVQAGFQELSYFTPCIRCFKGVALGPCDMVEWSINNGPFSTPVLGNQWYCFNFTSSGTYTIEMRVTRKKGINLPCETFTYNTTITVNCGIPPPDCSTPKVYNPGFDTLATPGVLGMGGSSAHWVRVVGSPKVESVPSSSDGWVMTLSGNSESYDAIGHYEQVCLEKDSGTINIMLRSVGDNGLPVAPKPGERLVIQLLRNGIFQSGACLAPDCYEIANIGLPEQLMDWTNVSVDYKLTGIMESDDCAAAPSLKARPIIYVANSLGMQDPNPNSHVQIDNFCLQGKGRVVGTYGPADKKTLRIFPNPNPGRFSVELPEPAIEGMSFQILSITGQVQLEQVTKTGLGSQTIQADDLPAGLYFLQLLSEGKSVGIVRFVKQ